MANLKTDFHTLSRTFSIEPRELTQSDHELLLRCQDPSDQKKRETIGIDFIWLQRR